MAKPLRFAVGNSTDIRSSVWRLWSHGDELYLAAQSLAGLLKVSFHKSGILRIAQPSSQPRPALGRYDFGRDSLEIAWRIFAIIVPPRLVKYPIQDKLWDNKEVICVPAPKPGFKTIFSIMMAGPHIAATDIRALPKDRDMKILGSLRLRTRTVWLLTYEDEFRAQIELPNVEQFLNQVRVPMSSQSDIVNVYVHIFGKDEGIVADVQIGREHCFIDPMAKPGKVLEILQEPKKPKRN